MTATQEVSATPLVLGPAATSRVRRWLRFSLTDILFIGILVWGVILSPNGWSRLLLDADTGLHIRIGNFILQNGVVPTTDPLSFTRNGSHWLATEWLTGAMFSFLNMYFGLKGVVFVCGVAIAATFAVVLRTCITTGANCFLSLIFVLMATNASSFHFHARPHVFTWLFLAISMHVLARDVSHPTGQIWWLVPLTAVWANLHGGYAVVFAVLGIFVAGSAFEEGYRSPRVIRYTMLAAGCGMASLLNPFGYNLPLETLRYLHDSNIQNSIQEFAAPDFRTESQMYFMGLLFAGLAVAGLLVTKRRYTQTLLLIAFGYLALTSVRHIPIYAIVAVPVIVRELSSIWSEWVGRQPPKSTAAVLDEMSLAANDRMLPISLWSLAGLSAILVFSARSSWPKDFPSDRFPTEIAARDSARLASSRLFTTDQWADYLMFKNPAQRVFLDDRSLYDPKIIADAHTLMDAGPGWKQLIDKYQIGSVLVPVETSLASALTEDRHWTLTDQNSNSRLFQIVVP